MKCTGFVYFIRAAEVGLVKIGYAADYRTRLRNIICNSPVEVELIAAIGAVNAADEEAIWHNRFRDDRVRGEWFRETPALRAAIEAAKRHCVVANGLRDILEARAAAR